MLSNHIVQDAYWRQRENIHWMKDGDTNSKFFHASANARKIWKFFNTIFFLKCEDGTLVHDHKNICDIVVSSFENGFQSDNNCNDFSLVINNIFTCVSTYDNDSLLAHFSIYEFK